MQTYSKTIFPWSCASACAAPLCLNSILFWYYSPREELPALRVIFMVTCICVRGSTLARLAMVLVWQSCGKPSTKFPHGGLVECPSIPQLSCLSFWKIQKKSKIIDIFFKILIFSKFLEIWNLMEPMFFITFSSFYHLHIDLRYTLDNES